MTLQFRTKSADFFFRKVAFGDLVQRHQDAQAKGYTATESPCLRDLALNREAKRKRLLVGTGEKQLRGLGYHPWRRPVAPAGIDGDSIPELQGNPQAIKART